MDSYVSQAPLLTVSELARQARLALEKALTVCWVKGELASLTRAASGHWYFTVKDDQASLRCVMFRTRNQFVDWSPREGEQVELRVQATLYEARGDFQLNVEAMRRAGMGDLYAAFLALKDKLLKEGLFDVARKRALPAYPRHIGVVTSPHGAAVHDVCVTLGQRWPVAQVTLIPCLVQGPQAPAQLCAALSVANQIDTLDVLLLVRGGGSLEDLMAYNSEAVARAIAGSRVPVISGVGHETDFTIADFVADLRAATPTAAAQAATPEAASLRFEVSGLRQRMRQQARHRLESAWQRLDNLQKRLRHPAAGVLEQRKQVETLQRRLHDASTRLHTQLHMRSQHAQARLLATRPDTARHLQHATQLAQRLRLLSQGRLAAHNAHLQRLQQGLTLLDPQQVLGRGYSIVRNQLGHIIRNAQEVCPGEEVEAETAHGRFRAAVLGRN